MKLYSATAKYKDKRLPKVGAKIVLLENQNERNDYDIVYYKEMNEKNKSKIEEEYKKFFAKYGYYGISDKDITYYFDKNQVNNQINDINNISKETLRGGDVEFNQLVELDKEYNKTNLLNMDKIETTYTVSVMVDAMGKNKNASISISNGNKIEQFTVPVSKIGDAFQEKVISDIAETYAVNAMVENSIEMENQELYELV